MTVNAVRRPRRRSVTADSKPAVMPTVDSMAIGEINQTVFDCPTCARPLAIGTRRCPGCGTRLVIGVPLSKAAVLTTAGLAVGLLLGCAGGFVAATRVLPQPVPAVAVPSAAPVARSSAGAPAVPTSAPLASTPGATAATTDTTMPPIVQSALVQAMTVNEQMAAASDALRSALTTAPFDPSQVAEILRSISADAVYGADLADRVGAWPDSAAIGADLSGAYGSVHDAATAILVASVRNTTAYRDGARSMITLLAGIRAVDTRVRALAQAQGVNLPEVSAQP